MFEPGAKVACVDDQFNDTAKERMTNLPVKDQTYTVADIVPGIGWDGKETVSVYIEELKNPTNASGIEYGFGCHRFRELEEDEHLEEATVEEEEPAHA